MHEFLAICYLCLHLLTISYYLSGSSNIFSEFSGFSMIFYNIPGIPRHLLHVYTRITLGKTKGKCELHNKFTEKWSACDAEHDKGMKLE